MSHSIRIDYGRNELLTPFARKTLEDRYLMQGEDPQEGFARVSSAFSGGDPELAQRLYDYSSKQWLSYASPVLANGGRESGLPISCFLNYVEDSIDGLVGNFAENAYMATSGGGIGSYWGHVRSAGTKTSKGVTTPGAVSFMRPVDGQMLSYHQGSTRRGSAAVYMDVSHPEIFDFIHMRSPSGGDANRKNLNLHTGVCVSDAFMLAVKDDKPWELVDPHSNQVIETVSARDLWKALLQERAKHGEPYIFFTDTANFSLPYHLKSKGMRIHASNLCTEIMLPTSDSRSAVCCLSSVNVRYYEDWRKDPQFIDDCVTMLDNVLEVFIGSAPKQLWRARNSAIGERSIGLGVMGLMTYFQDNNIVVGSESSRELNKEIFSHIKSRALAASERLAELRGEPEDMKGSGKRHAHLIAVAPNATTSIIAGSISPGIEPLNANAFAHKTDSGHFIVRNPSLSRVLSQYNKDTPEVWESIASNQGSVQHLSFLNEYDKAVFRTAVEIDQLDLIRLAADRQPFICQGQSLNLFLPDGVTGRDMHKLHFQAWQLGLKSLYYVRTEAVRPSDIISTYSAVGVGECVACEG